MVEQNLASDNPLERALGEMAQFGGEANIAHSFDAGQNHLFGPEQDANFVLKGYRGTIDKLFQVMSAWDQTSRAVHYDTLVNDYGVAPEVAAASVRRILDFSASGTDMMGDGQSNVPRGAPLRSLQRSVPTFAKVIPFFRTSMAGIARTKDVITGDGTGAEKWAHMAKTVTPLAVSGYLLSMLLDEASGVDDEGERNYSKISDMEALSNITYNDGESDLKVPIPHGLGMAAYAIGAAAYRAQHGYTEPDSALAKASLVGAQQFLPLRIQNSDSIGEGVQRTAINSTVLAPALQILDNENAFGSPIRPEHNTNAFDFDDAFATQHPVWEQFTTKLFDTLGTDINPEQLQHGSEGYLPLVSTISRQMDKEYQEEVGLVRDEDMQSIAGRLLLGPISEKSLAWHPRREAEKRTQLAEYIKSDIGRRTGVLADMTPQVQAQAKAFQSRVERLEKRRRKLYVERKKAIEAGNKSQVANMRDQIDMLNERLSKIPMDHLDIKY